MPSAAITSCTGAAETSPQMYGCAQPTSARASTATEFIKAPFWTGGVLAAFFIAGTGGAISCASTSAVVQKMDSSSTGSMCRIECVSKSRLEDETERIAGSAEGLPTIQHHLSLNLSDLAAVLRVSRPTIYTWLRSESSPQAHNVSRMRLLFRVAKTWAGVSPRPLGSHLKTAVVEGQSVFDLLSQERIERELVRGALATCSRKMEQEAARPRPRSAAEIAGQYGLRSQSKHSQEESVAQETGL
jgi:hypothetical protein